MRAFWVKLETLKHGVTYLVRLYVRLYHGTRLDGSMQNSLTAKLSFVPGFAVVRKIRFRLAVSSRIEHLVNKEETSLSPELELQLDCSFFAWYSQQLS